MKTERKKISIKKKPVDLDAAQDFINGKTDPKIEHPQSETKKEDPKINQKVKSIKKVLPWEEDGLNLEKLTTIPIVSLPKEYALKLHYIMKKVGYTKQSVCRNAIIERIDEILEDHFSKKKR